MTQWIQSSKTKQDGTPITRAIRIDGMDEEIFFTENAYAEVADDVGDLLASQLDDITKVSEPSTPGSYYGDAGQNTTVEIVLPDEAFDHLTAESGDIDSLSADAVSLSGEATTGLHLPDNVNLDFGTDSELSLRYLPDQNKVQFFENINDRPVLDIHENREVKIPAEIHTRRLFGINDSTIEILTDVTANSIQLGQDPGFVLDPAADAEAHIESAGGNDAQAFNFQFLDDDGALNRIAWSRGSAGEAFRVWDIDTQTTLFKITDDGESVTPPKDVRTVSAPEAGMEAYHDGSGTDNTEGPAHYTTGGSWVSTVDGTAIN